jgi:hypothetical protein
MGFGVRTNNWRQPVCNEAITLLQAQQPSAAYHVDI